MKPIVFSMIIFAISLIVIQYGFESMGITVPEGTFSAIIFIFFAFMIVLGMIYR